jgi:polyphosphate kinase 2 (PPK2 family)
MFGNWYSDLLVTATHVSEPLDDARFDAYVENMRAFEQDLKNNYVDVIKVWFDLSWKSLQKRLDKIDPSEQHWHKLHGLDWRNKNNMTLCKSYAVALPMIGTLLMGKMKTARSIFCSVSFTTHASAA